MENLAPPFEIGGGPANCKGKGFFRACLWVCIQGCLVLFLTFGPASHAQMTLPSVIRLAMGNSARVKAAKNDLEKAQAGVAVAKDLYIPSVMTTAGLGDSYGITLSVPTIFTIGAQSLVYSDQQRYYIRAAHSDLLAAGLALTEARDEVEEDAAITYISLNESQMSAAALAEQWRFAEKLEAIVQDRINAGLDSDLELKKAERGTIQIKLAQMQMEDNIATLCAHISELTGEPINQVRIVPESIPDIPSYESFQSDEALNFADNPGVLAAEATAEAKLERAHGDSRYTWKPIINFNAQYGRVSPINNVSEFYNLHGIYNTWNAGVQIQLPILDKVRKAAARQSVADAARAAIDVGNLQAQLADDRQKLQSSMPELALKAKLARLDFEIAGDELKAATIQTHSTGVGTPPMSPKEEQEAHLEERQKYLDFLDSEMQFAKAEIWMLRQTGRLASWIEAGPHVTSSAGAPSGALVEP